MVLITRLNIIMNKELIEAFELYEKMIEEKLDQKEYDLSLKRRLYAGLFLFFVTYSILITIGLIVDIFNV